MNAVSQKIREQLRRVQRMEIGEERMLLAKAVDGLADVTNDPALAYEVRMELSQSASAAGFHDVALVAFIGCLTQWDKDPQRFSASILVFLRRYKWILDTL